MGKHLDFYKECMKTGKLPEADACNSNPWGGLCQASDKKIISKELLNLFEPLDCTFGWWGVGDKQIKYTLLERLEAFTPLRQTIVLFMAAINNEL